MALNRAGKSIIRQAFGDLLFGIHGQIPMGFRFGYNGMKLMAEAIGPDRAPFNFGRRKGQGNTLIDADGTPLPGANRPTAGLYRPRASGTSVCTRYRTAADRR